MDALGLLDTGGEGLRVGLCSHGLARFRSLPAFLGLGDAQFSHVHPLNRQSFDLYLGWGRKPSGNKALQLSERTGKPFLLLEDGFLRSAHPASVAPAPPFSLAVDDTGIYYDSRAPSRLEHLVANAATSDEAHREGAQIIATLRAKKLCKYNSFIPLPDDLQTNGDRPPVLVVDQTAGDLSVSGAQADARSFELMLEAARDENPGADIWIKTHPETAVGRRKGYFADAAGGSTVKLITEPVNPWELFFMVSGVYVVSSQLGFDAVMAGLEVRCFGLPFYAGWGLTIDELDCPRRGANKPSAEQLAAAVYARYCRYLDPYRQVPSCFEETAAQLAAVAGIAEAAHDMGPIVSIFPWNRRTVRAMFQTFGKAHRFHRTVAGALADQRGGTLPVSVWSSRLGSDEEAVIRKSGRGVFRIEDGFLRSVGLGTNFHQPMSLVLDRAGIHYDAGKPSDVEIILGSHPFEPQLTDRARSLIDTILLNDISKYNVGSAKDDEFPSGDRKCVLVPGQVENDASVLHSGSGLKDTMDLLRAVRAENREAYIVFKPHPDVLAGQRPGLSDEEMALQFADQVVTGISIGRAISACDELHTLSSLAGFEALLRGKMVACYGMPFYAGWGLTSDKILCGRRQRKLSIEELVAGALILYPHYLDPVSGLPCTPEVVLQRMIQMRQNAGPGALLVRARRQWGQLRLIARRWTGG
ncbi:MAG: capsular polysaccharide biosynthesis protein [Pseudomonadota bacterium]